MYISQEDKGNIGCFVIVFVFVVCFVAGMCAIGKHENSFKPTIPIEPVNINIDSVMEHQYRHYSVKYKAEDGRLASIYLGYDAEIFADVPENQPMWALLQRSKSESGDTFYMSGQIHIHSAKDINGAGYQRREGKHWVDEQTNTVEAK